MKDSKYGIEKIKDDEEFRDVFGYENYYIVSSYGRIFSKNYRRTKTIGELAQSTLYDKRRNSETGYKRVKMFHVNSDTPTIVHRIVAITFLGPAPIGRNYVNHKNGDKGDNRVCNIEWTSNQENVVHAVNGGMYPDRKGSKHRMAKIDEKMAAEIKKMALCGMKTSEIALKTGVSIHIINDIRGGYSWKHV